MYGISPRRFACWLMKLNANGGRVSERLDGQLVASSVTAGAAGTLVFADFDSRSRQTRLLRVNEHLEVVDRREIPSSGFGLLRSTAAVSGIGLIAYQVSLKATLYSLGEHQCSCRNRFHLHVRAAV
jgi:hypothetical protein